MSSRTVQFHDSLSGRFATETDRPWLHVRTPGLLRLVARQEPPPENRTLLVGKRPWPSSVGLELEQNQSRFQGEFYN